MFDIDNFNVVQDDKYYYVFRSLEAGDISDINEGITSVMRTDRERYKGIAKYKEDSTISLEEMFDHIKVQYRHDTNCISFTTNAGVALYYGRDTSFDEGVFNDKYAVLKVPKSELGTISYFAPDYMISEINKVLDEYYENSDPVEQYYFDRIDNATTQKQIDDIMKESISLDDECIFEGEKLISSIDYFTLSKEQNLEKNKMIAKISLLPYNIIKNINNSFLKSTLGNAFASMEVTHYGSINGNELASCPSYIMDILFILQQSNIPETNIIIKKLIYKLYNHELDDLEEFKYKDYELTEDDLSIDNLYEISEGKIDYNTMRNLYTKTYYYTKSKLRMFHSIKLLKEIFNGEYEDIIEKLKSCYGLETQIINKQSVKKIKISDSLGLDFNSELEIELLKILENNYLTEDNLEELINNKKECSQILMIDLLKEDSIIDKNEYYLNALIDAFDWKKYNISSIGEIHKEKFINRLKELDYMTLYEQLKGNNYSYKEISRILISNIVKGNKEIEYDIDIEKEEIEEFLGYYKVIGTNINLRRFQADAVKNAKEAYNNYSYTNVILPTSTGKSFVAITLMLEYLFEKESNGKLIPTNKKVLYLSPTNEILEQICEYLVKYVIGYKDTLGKNTYIDIVKEKIPNLKLTTYADLRMDNDKKNLTTSQYDFIIMDELQYTGAQETKPMLEKLFKNQSKDVKALGITATPVRDCDNIDMAEYWANYFGYSTREIIANKHLAYDMDSNQAIILGYLSNPRVVNCEYNLLDEDGEIDEIIELLNSMEESSKKDELLKKYEKLKKHLKSADGVDKILKDNIHPGENCIVYCPIVNKDENGKQIIGIDVLELYKKKLEEIYGSENINCYFMHSNLTDSINSENLKKFQQLQPNKINFMIVVSKYDVGIHVPCSKMIWYRNLDENSYTLLSQQMGRVMKGLMPGQLLAEEEKPLIIDLPNNLLKVHNDKNFKKSRRGDDLTKFRLVVEWILANNKIPDINSKDKIEANMASTLKIIIFKYRNRVKNIELEKSEKDKIRVSEIKRLSDLLEYDIWDLRLPKRTKATKKRLEIPYFELTPLYRDFVNIKEELEQLSDRFEHWYPLAQQYYESNGHLKVPQGYETETGEKLGSWISKQRTAYSKGELKPERIEKLEAIGMIWKVGKSKEEKLEFEDWYPLAQQYYESNGHLKVPQGYETEKGEKLAIWISTQRVAYSKGELKPEQIEKLEAIGMIWDVFEEEWNKNYTLAQQYYESNGHLKVPKDYVTEKGENLGDWISTQRVAYSNGKLKPERIEKLEAIGMIWKVGKSKEEKLEFEDWYPLAQQYYESEGHLHIPQSYVTETGEKLGKWIKNLRVAYSKGKLKSEQIEKLEAIGMLWKVGKSKEEKLEFEDWYLLAQQYYESEGHLHIPQSYVTETGEKLGNWIPTQRVAYSKGELKPEQIEKLEAIGMIWDVFEEEWNKNYTLAQQYYESNGHLKVPQRYVTNLGEWISTQREAYSKGKLKPEKIEKLEAIGMIWDVSEEEWNKKYTLAKQYADLEGHLKVPKDYVTKKGEYLGEWISKQRVAYSNGKLNPERIEKLEAIGMIWNIMNNKSNIEQLCNEYNINYKKNKKYVNKLSLSIFSALLKYFIDNNISYVDDKGILISDFYMSSKDFEMKYGISIIELLNKEKRM